MTSSARAMSRRVNRNPRGLPMDTKMRAGDGLYALTLAFTTFVLFQFFNVFNARNEHGSAFNAHFLHNGKLWMALTGVLAMQGLVVHWAPAQALFGTTDLALADWLRAAMAASSVLLLDEARKLGGRLFGRLPGKTTQ